MKIYISETMIVQYDEGVNRITSVTKQLPIVEMTILQDSDPMTPGTANMTLGPLICWGNSE